MEELPAELTIDILSRLPVRTIVQCKRVCKKWRNLVWDSSFGELHLSRSPTTGLFIHQYRNRKHNNLGRTVDPGILKWLEIEDKEDHRHLLHDPLMNLDLSMVPFFQNSIIDLMGSANGLIFVWQHSCHPRFDDTYICNPVTGEILILPTPPQYHKHCFAKIGYGFGVSSLTGEYKVVRTLRRKLPLNGGDRSREYKVVIDAEVYTLGTGQWRSLGPVSYWIEESEVGAVLNNHCHWIVPDYEDSPETIFTFDLNKETFQLFPSPPSEESDNPFESLAVLKGCLCKSDGNDSQFMIWMMKEYGVKKSWHKEVVITKEALNRSRGWPYWYTVSLIEGLKDGTIFFMNGGLWALYPRTNTVEKIDTFGCTKSGLAYRPTFLKLQNFGLERVHMF